MSTIVVTPPHAAAREPVSNVSLANVPPNGSSMWVWTSIPPGDDVLAGGVDHAVGALLGGGEVARARRRRRSSRRRSARRWAITPVVEMTCAVLDQRACAIARLLVERLSGRRARRRRRGGGRGRTPSRSRTSRILSRSRSRTISSGLYGVADVADELPSRVDEVALPVEVVLAERLDADAVDRADVVHVRDRRRRLLEPPEVLAQAAMRRRRVEHDLGAVEAEAPPALGEVPVVADVDADLADGGLEDRDTRRFRA